MKKPFYSRIQEQERLPFYAFLSLLVFFVGAVYVRTLAPTVGSEDSGELITAAYVLGIPHGPGFPLWCLLGKLFTFLPISNVAWRINLMSAFFALSTVVFTYLIVFRITRKAFAAFIAGISLAFSIRFWSQAMIAEVYCLNTFLLVLGLYVLLIWQERKESRYLVYFALVYGLAQTNHYMLSLLMLPAYLEFVHREERVLYSNWKKMAFLMGIFLCCQLLYLYLPIRSKANPPIDWGDPENFSNFLYHVMRKQARSIDFGQAFSPVDHFRFLLFFFKELSVQFTFLLLPFGIVGIFILNRLNRSFFVMTLLVFIINSVGLNLVLQFHYNNENLLRYEPYYLPAYCIFALWIGMGVHRSLEALGRFVSSRAELNAETAGKIAAVFILLLALIPLFAHYSFNDQSRNRLAYDLSVDILNIVDKNAIIFPSGDFVTFPLVYLIAVEGMRKDVIIGDKTGFLDNEVHSTYARISEAPRQADRMTVEKWVIKASGRPVYYTFKGDVKDVPGFEARPEAILFRMARTDDKKRDYSSFWKDRKEMLERKPEPFMRELDLAVLATYHEFLGLDYLGQDRRDEALREFEQTAILSVRVPGVLNNLGSALAERGMYDKAIEYFEKALQIDPNYLIVHKNLAQIYVSLGKEDKVLEHYREMERIDPKNPQYLATVEDLKSGQELQERILRYQAEVQANANDKAAHNNLGSAYAQACRYEDAEKEYKAALAVDPGYGMALLNLKLLYERTGRGGETRTEATK